jgi:hypothetical protein
MKKLFEISKTALWFSLFIGLAWLIFYILGNTMLGVIFAWIFASLILSGMLYFMFLFIGELYIYFKKKIEEDKEWPFETGDKTYNDIVKILFAILVGSIILLLLDYVPN